MINFRYKSEKRQNKQVAYGLWNDAQEKWKVGYVCQIKKIPTTAAGPTTAAATTSSCLGAVSQCGDGTSTPLGTCCDGYECVPLSATAAYCFESSTSSTTTSTCGGSGSACLDTTGAATTTSCCDGFNCTPPSSGTIFTCVQQQNCYDAYYWYLHQVNNKIFNLALDILTYVCWHLCIRQQVMLLLL